jgi:Protein of unknown function (DUF3667)
MQQGRSGVTRRQAWRRSIAERPSGGHETGGQRARRESSNTCGNCDAPLTGLYCAQCGQHAHGSARTLGAVLHEGWDLTAHVDHRFWFTLWTLLAKPGQLTVDYFADRRARYISPLRLYFVLSIAFFALAAADSNVLSKSAASGQAPAAAADSAAHLDLGGGGCEKIELRWPWLQARLRAACERQLADNGKSMSHAFASYIPKMMFLFLPLMALVMVPLYRGTHHYYVEHLVFFLHTHAALFLVIMGDMLLGLLAHWLPSFSGVASLGDIAAAGYAGWCVYRAMRRYYDESRVRTLAKLAVIGIAYQLFLIIMIAATLLLSALTA